MSTTTREHLWLASVARHIEEFFHDALEVGEANKDVIGEPLICAVQQSKLLIRDRAASAVVWLKNACDPFGTVKLIDWRAPLFVGMAPALEMAFDARRAQQRTDAKTTVDLMRAHRDLFAAFLERELEAAKRHAVLTSAKTPKTSLLDAISTALGNDQESSKAAVTISAGTVGPTSSQRAQDSQNVCKPSRQKRSNPLNTILQQIIQAGITGEEVAASLDARGIHTPSAWRSEGCPKKWVEAYKNCTFRQRLQDRMTKQKNRM